MKLTIQNLRQVIKEAITQVERPVGSGAMESIVAELEAHTAKRLADRARLRGKKDRKEAQQTYEVDEAKIHAQIRDIRDRAMKIVSASCPPAQAASINKDIERTAYTAGEFYWYACTIENDELVRRRAERFINTLKKAASIVALGGRGPGSKTKIVKLLDEEQLQLWLQHQYDLAKSPSFKGLWDAFKSKKSLAKELARRCAMRSTADKSNVYHGGKTGVRVAKGFYSEEVIEMPEFAPVMAIITDFVNNLDRKYG